MSQIEGKVPHQLIEKVEKLKLVIGNSVKRQIQEFCSFKFKDNESWFSELCFCILTANSSAEMGIKIQKELGYEGFASLNENELAEKLRELGYRFYNVRADYIVRARRFLNIKDIIVDMDPFDARNWLVENVKGYGYKEASHFMRNVGYLDFAILDRHILRMLHNHGIVEKPKYLVKRRYLEIERVFVQLAEELEIRPGELDLYLWYLATGKILK
jgi:N-glycosylase/DNA lyase